MGTTRPIRKVTTRRPRQVSTALSRSFDPLAASPNKERAVNRHLRTSVADTLTPARLLGHAGELVVVEGRAEDEPIHVGPHGRGLDLLEQDDEGRGFLMLLLDLQVHRRPLVRIALQ